MGVCFNVYKECPTCKGRASMQLRGGVTDIDLDDHEELARTHTPEDMVKLYDRIVDDGDPFICESCGWDHRFFLDTPARRLDIARRLATARMLFGDKE